MKVQLLNKVVNILPQCFQKTSAAEAAERFCLVNVTREMVNPFPYTTNLRLMTLIYKGIIIMQNLYEDYGIIQLLIKYYLKGEIALYCI